MRFAIVDDEPDVPEQIAEMLKNYVPDIQIETNCFHQPSEFLEMYYNCNYDAVFLDIDMPAINGFDLSQQIYEKNNSIPIVYITSRDDLIIHAFRYKPLGFVRKQFIASELPYALTTILKEINQKVLLSLSQKRDLQVAERIAYRLKKLHFWNRKNTM